MSENDLYFAMDWLGEQQERIEGALAAKHLKGGLLVLYDITSTYSKVAPALWRSSVTAGMVSAFKLIDGKVFRLVAGPSGRENISAD